MRRPGSLVAAPAHRLYVSGDGVVIAVLHPIVSRIAGKTSDLEHDALVSPACDSPQMTESVGAITSNEMTEREQMYWPLVHGAIS